MHEPCEAFEAEARIPDREYPGAVRPGEWWRHDLAKTALAKLARPAATSFKGRALRCSRLLALARRPPALQPPRRERSIARITGCFAASLPPSPPLADRLVRLTQTQQEMPPKTHFCCSCWIYWPSSRLIDFG